MKIRAPVRAIYSEQLPIYAAVQKRVDGLFQPQCRKENWHYESRVKQEESFALKMEMGQTTDPTQLDDFFACTVVVRNSTEIAKARNIIAAECNILHSRPKNARRTKNMPASFEFDDLRLYVKLKKPPGVPDAPDFEKIFEIQVKTFLLHAWSIATHDLTYKTDDVSWSRARIAFQVRAMLENAELSIRGADQLAQTDLLNREDHRTSELRKVIEFVKKYWKAEQLPADLRRLAQNIDAVLIALNIRRDRLEQLIVAEAAGAGLPVDENAYQTSVRLLLLHEEAKIRLYVAEEKRHRLVFYGDADLPDWIKSVDAKNVVVIG